MEQNELSRLYADVAPYISNHNFIRKFLEKHGHLPREKLIKKAEFRSRKRTGMLRTDYKILLNKLLEERN